MSDCVADTNVFELAGALCWSTWMIASGRVSLLVRQRSSIIKCVIAMASTPPVKPMPNCLDCRSCLVVAVLSESRIRRVITLRIHSPTWMGLTLGVDGVVLEVVSEGRACGGLGERWLRCSLWSELWLSCVLKVAVAFTFLVQLGWKEGLVHGGRVGSRVSLCWLCVTSHPCRHAVSSLLSQSGSTWLILHRRPPDVIPWQAS